MPKLKNFTKIGECSIDPSATVCPGSMVGKPFRPLLGVTAQETKAVTVIGPNVYVGYYSLVGSGTVLEPNVVVDDFSVIECDVVLGHGSFVIYRAQICNEAR